MKGSEARTYEEFMGDLMASDPEKYAVIAHRFPVLSNRRMSLLGEQKEIPMSQLNGRDKTLAMQRQRESSAFLFDAVPEIEEAE